MRTAIRCARLLAAAAVLAGGALLPGCGGDELEVDNGPELSVYGRLSIRKIGEPLLIGNYVWHRAPSQHGWRESFEVTDQNGFDLFSLESDDEGTVLNYFNRTQFTSDTLREIMADQLGIDIETRRLAGWLENDYGGGTPVPKSFVHEGVLVEVIERATNGRPAKMRFVQDEAIVLMSIHREFPTN